MAKKITGRFDTRQELEERVWWFYLNSDMNQTRISDACGVSATTVSNILKENTYNVVRN